MSRKTRIYLVLIVLFIIATASLVGSVVYYARLPQNLSQHETIILGQNHFVPDSQAALRVLVRDSKNGSPLSGASVEVNLQPETGEGLIQLYSGKTSQTGNAEITFNVPENAGRSGTLIIKTHSNLGSDTVERPVTIERDFRVLLTTDKPIYQPGQVIHTRALALSAFDLRPAAGQPLEMIIADGKGNKVFRQTLTTNEYGVAFSDFQLADEVNTGAYKITAVSGDTSSEKTVSVEHYVLPKFEVTVETAKSFYQPGQHVEGTLQARYFFGKPVNNAQVTIEGFTFDVERSSIFTLEGQTDAEGVYSFAFDLPAYLTGSDFEGGITRFYLEANVTDQAQHSETSNLSLPVSASALVVEAVPEGGYFRPGIENILYILASYPDGSPAEASLRIDLPNSGTSFQAQTGSYGLAEVRFTPDNPYQYLIIEATDAQGNSGRSEMQYEGNWSEESILLRPDRPVYKVGETMLLSILTSGQSGTVYLDIVRDGQTVSTRSVDVSGGKAEAAIDLTPDLYGTLELHAYKVFPSGSIARDTRLVAVSQADDLQVSLTPAQDVYRPGDTTHLDVQVKGAGGEGVQSAFGLAIVDESVFALAETDPGFAKLYFLLEKEILQPRFDLHGYSVPDLMRGLPEPDPALESAANIAAQASLSHASRQTYAPGANAFSLTANSHQDAMQRAYDRQRTFFSGLSKALLVLFLVIPLIIAGLTTTALLREKNLGRSALLGLAVIAAVFLFLAVIPSPGGFDYGGGPLNRIQGWLSWLSYEGASAILLLLLAAPTGYVVLIIMSIRAKDGLMGWILGLLPLFVASLVLLVMASSTSSFQPDDALLVPVVIAFFLVPLALLLRLAGFFLKHQTVAGLMLLPLVLFLAGGFLPILSSSQLGVGNMKLQGEQRNLMVVEEAMPMMAARPAALDAGEMAVKEEEKNAGAAPSEQGQTGSELPRLRQYFPETMLWLPDGVTDADGRAALEIPAADSITTWRMTALASSQDGRMGSASAPLVVFQDFFIDLDLPLSLTVGDEIAVPVGVFNYLTEEQTVRLELEQADWFELQGGAVQEMTIAANDISVIYFRIRATRFGMQPFKVTALGSKMSDAILKQVHVYPDGKEIRFTRSDRLAAESPVKQTVTIPADAIPGTQNLVVKIYPGILSQVVEGLDSILRMPYGCFEQTSSTTYPNVLVLDYLKTTNQAAPEAQMKAEEYINLGYQRLTTFEVASSGGFSLFGNPPADRMLTAYGLQEFSDMARVHDVDPDLIRRAAEWLLSQQASDGSWENDQGLVHENTWSSLGNDRLPVSAYITWSLVEAGFGSEAQTQKGLQYVREFQGQAEDPYVVALVANALVAADLESVGGEISKSTAAVLDRLAGMALRDGEGAYWQSSVATFMGSEGQTGSIETTALAALALLRAESHPQEANAALVYLVRQKDSYGTWYSTQATVLSLKALLQSVRGNSEQTHSTVTITLNGGQTRTLSVTPENYDVVQMVSFDDVNPGRDNQVEIQTEGKGSLMYQITGS